METENIKVYIVHMFHYTEIFETRHQVIRIEYT